MVDNSDISSSKEEMLKIKDEIITDVYTLKDIFNIILPTEECCKLYISEEGLNISVVDSARFAQLELEMNKEHISSYNINQLYILYINVADMVKILADHDDNETVEISLGMRFDEKFKIHTHYIMKIKVGSITHNISYFIPEREYEKDSLCISDGGLKEISIITKDLKTITRDFYKFSDLIIFETRDGRIRASCISEDNDSHEIHAYIGENITDNLKCIFDLDYLKDMANAINDRWSSGITLLMGTDLPLKIRFNVGRYGSAIYTLAPKVPV